MIYVIDVETTGLDPTVDRVVEIAAVPMRLRDGADPAVPGALVHIEEGTSSLVYPGIPIPPGASAIHHLIDEDVEGAPPLGRAIDAVLGPLWRSAPELIFVAQNAPFDKSFLPMTHENRWIDTCRCARHVWPDAPGFGNQCLRYFLGLRVPRDLPVHRALGDAIVTAHLLARLLDERSLDDLLKLSKKAVLLKTINFGKHKGAAWAAAPTSYLEWLRDQKSDDHDVRFTVKFELARRIEALKERGLV